MKLPRAFILDFDGIIVATEQKKFAWLKNTLQKKGVALRANDFARMVGKKTAAFLEERFGKTLTHSEIKKIRTDWRKERLRQWQKYSRPIPGVIAFIKAMTRKGVKLCLATGTEKPIVHKALQHLGLRTAFVAMITGNACAVSKPNPLVYQLAQRALHIPPKDILVIEDSVAGIRAAQRAGIRCIALATTHHPQQLQQADTVVSSFKELQKLFD